MNVGGTGAVAGPDDNAVTEFVAGVLEGSQTCAVGAHVDACTSCRTTLVEFARCFHARPAADVDRPPASLVADGLTPGRYVPRRVVSAEVGLAYEGFDRRQGRAVTIFVILDANAAGRERIDRETRALSRLTHPNIVAVLDHEWRRGHALVVTAPVPPVSFATWLQQGPRSPADVVRIVVDAARGLWAAHRRGVVHRRVGPDAIVVGRDGRAAVAYFVCTPGSGFRTRSLTASRQHADEAHLGRGPGDGQAYVAPEVRAGAEAGPAADQYSLSVVAMEALSNIDGVPESVARVLRRGRAPGPSRRFESMAAFGHALHRAGRRTSGQRSGPATLP